MRKCEVLVHGIPAGILTETDPPTEYIFAYHSDYIGRGAAPVCLAMPLRADPYRSKVLFPYFFNMLSEGDNRALQSSYLHIDPSDDFGIMLETAQYDTPGAVTVRPLNA